MAAPDDAIEKVNKFGDLTFARTSRSLYDGIQQELASLGHRAPTSFLLQSIVRLVGARSHRLKDAFIESYIDPMAKVGLTAERSNWLFNKLQSVWDEEAAKAKQFAGGLATAVGIAPETAHPFIDKINRTFSEIGSRTRNEINIKLAELALHGEKARPGEDRKPRQPSDYQFHPEISRVAEDLLREGHYRQAVHDAFIRLIEAVQTKSGLANDGDDLMNRTFCSENRSPIVRFNALQTRSENDEQRGLWYLFKGVVALRNFKSHTVAPFDDPERAHEYLALASLLMRRLEAAQVFAEAVPPEAG